MHLSELPRPGSYRAGQLAVIAGNTGNARTTPTHFHVEAYRGGRRIDPRPLFAAGTAGPAGDASGGTPPVRDLGQANAWVDSLNLPYDMRMALRREVGQRIATQRAVVEQRQSEAADQAYEFYARNPEGFTNTNVIPRQVWNAMDARQRAQFEGLASQARDRIEARARATTNWEAYARFSDMAGSDPQGFLNVSTAELRRNLSDGDFEQFMGLRRSIQAAGRGTAPEQVTHSRVNGITDPLLLAAGIARPPERDRNRGNGAEADREYWETVGQFRQRVSEGVRLWQRNNPGREISDDDIASIAQSQLVRSWRQGQEGSERWLFQQPTQSGLTYRIPQAQRDRIINTFRARNRRDPSEAEIDQIWRFGPVAARRR